MAAAISKTCFALLVAPLQLATLAAARGKSCNGEFKCESIDKSERKHVDVLTGECRYGHTEVGGGGCDSPCDGTRLAPCRCMGKAEAEKAVEDHAGTQMNIILAVGALLSLPVGFSLWKRMKMRQRQQQAGMEAESGAEGGGQGAEEAGVGLAEGGNESAKAGDEVVTADAVVIGVAETNQQNAVETNQQNAEEGGADEVVTGKSGASIASISRSRSRIDDMDAKLQQSPQRALITRAIGPLFLVGLLGYWLHGSLTSEQPWDATLETFLPVVATILVIVGFGVTLLLFSARVGVQNLTKIGPLRLTMRTFSVVFALSPLLCLVAFAWTYNRKSNPEGVYFDCTA